MLKEWLDDLRAALDKEFAGAPRPVCLATVDHEGKPAARMVILRKVDDSGAMFFVSDARSEKNKQLRARSHAEIVIWLSALRQQYRVKGEVVIEKDATLWKELSEPTRAMFFWPPPGEPRAADEAFVRTLPDHAAIPENFEVLALVPAVVERLKLDTFPHERIRQTREMDWTPVRLNP
ncbi:MAG TPA: pyridoxamine 5'-phosphate oxidase family protein [Tepidisphaeraceae bacterium]|jgi:pyridoxamine 5'-phosphate oxidase